MNDHHEDGLALWPRLHRKGSAATNRPTSSDSISTPLVPRLIRVHCINASVVHLSRTSMSEPLEGQGLAHIQDMIAVDLVLQQRVAGSIGCCTVGGR